MDRLVTTILLATLGAGLFTGCSTPTPVPRSTKDMANVPEPVPSKEPPSATGNPESYVVFGKRYYVHNTSEGYRQRGTASWYGSQFHGKKTSSGPTFDMYEVTAAHKNLPIPTYARVTNLGNGRSIVVKINDRGPFVDDRVIDLSYAAATKLGMVEAGTAPVEVAALPPYQYLSDFVPGQPDRALALERNADDRPEALPQLASATPAAAVNVFVAQPLPPSDKPRFVSPLASAPAVIAAPAALTAPQAPPPPLPAVATENSTVPVYLQVGAFSERVNAEQLQQKLTGQINQAVRIDSSAGNLHKVRVGPLNNADEARQIMLRLASLGIKAHPVAF